MRVWIVAAVAAFVLCGCQGTKSVITEYNAEGKVVKTTETSESVVKEVTASTKDKTVVAWESGWAAYMSVSTATTQDPTPTAKMFAGKTDKGLVSALKDQQNWDGIANVINATKYELNVTTSGLSGTSAKTDTASASGTSVKTESTK